jgi:hypothetical protein
MHTLHETSLSDSSDEESQTTTDLQPPKIKLPPIPNEIRLTPDKEVHDLNDNHYDESFETVSSDKNTANEQQPDSLHPSNPSLSYKKEETSRVFERLCTRLTVVFHLFCKGQNNSHMV